MTRHLAGVAPALLLLASLVAPLRAQDAELGDIDFPTSGRGDAQAHFLRGVAWLHSFGYADAMEAFQEAQRIDPAFVMAYWGEAMTHSQPIWYTEDLAAARGVLARLGPTREARAARAPTPRERGYLEAIEILFGPGDARTRAGAYAEAMARVSAAYPADDEAACFLALALLGTIEKGRQDVAIRERAGAIAEAVFARNPRHPGAAHLVIHAYDDREHAARALGAARAYAAIAPASSHALHMPAHIFLQLGMWDEAARSDAASFAASDAWVKRKGFSLASRDYHSLSWLQYEYLQQGRYRQARETLAPLEEAVALNTEGLAHEPHHQLTAEESREGRSVRLLASMRARYVIETRRFADMRGQKSFDNLDELFAAGMSAAILGDLPRAKETARLLGLQVAGETDAIEKQLARVMEKEMAGMVAIAEQRTEEGVGLLREATALEDTIPKPIGRPYPVKGSHELLAEILLGLRRFPESAEQFRRSLDRVANRSLSVLGLARATREMGDRDHARELYRQFLANWRLADAELPEREEARRFIDSTAGASAPAAAPASTTGRGLWPWLLGGTTFAAGALVFWRWRTGHGAAATRAARRRTAQAASRRAARR
jgi:tetratricopeptide (TPR) repeat protein